MFRLQVCPRRIRRFDAWRRDHYVVSKCRTFTQWRGANFKKNGDLGYSVHRVARDSGTRYVQWQSCHMHGTFTQTWASEYLRCRCIRCFERGQDCLIPGPPNLAVQYFIFLNPSYSFCTHLVFCELGGIVDMTTGFELEGPGIESQWRRDFSAAVQTGLGIHPASCRMGTGSFPGVKRPGRDFNRPPYLVLRSKKE